MGAFALIVALVLQSPAAATPPPVEVPFRNLGFGSNGKIKDGGAVVMRNLAAFNKYRKQMGTDDARLPTIDWAKEEVVAVHAAGVGYGGASLNVSKVRKDANGGLEVEAWLDRGNMTAVPTPGDVHIIRSVGLYALIAVDRQTGPVKLKVIDPPKGRGGKTGTGG